MELSKLPALQTVWRIVYGSAGVILGLGAGAILGRSFGLSSMFAAAIGGAAVLGLFGFYYAGRAFEHYQARLLEGEGIVLCKGVWWQEEIMVPMVRLQHIDLNQGPLDRRWSMAQLVIYTAGTHDKGTSIKGLPVEQAHALRERLLPRTVLVHD